MEQCSKVVEKILENKDEDLYVLFIRKTCGYSIGAMDLLKEKDLSFKAYDVSKIKGDKEKVLECLSKDKEIVRFNSDHNTVPIIFYKGEFIGGFNDLKDSL